jgi:hypothetical protein
MKLLNSQKNKFKKKNNSYRKIHAGGFSANKSTRESQILLKHISERKRNVITPRKIFRKKQGLFGKMVVSLILISTLVFLAIKFDVPSYFKISSINIEGVGKFVSYDDVRSVVGSSVLEKYIFSVDEVSVAENIKKSFLGAKNVTVKRNYPHSIDVLVEERVPLAVAYNKDGEGFLIDSEGFVLGVVDKNVFDLPKIKYEGPIMVGTFLEKDIIPVSIEIIEFAEKEDLKISSMSFKSTSAHLFVGRNTEVFMGYDKEIEQSLKTIKALIKKSDVEGRLLKKIDLRYDKVIVLYD